MILNLDCRHGLAMLPDNSVDAVVCDPPYGLSFMGKKWDYDVPSVEIWAECLRVLKPGGHLLAFAGTRTQHRMAVRIEDAGFEIRDMIAWVYGSGYPKHRSSLKPALEPITMARKPAARATLLNIDACRVGDEGGTRKANPSKLPSVSCYGNGLNGGSVEPIDAGRYPANFIHDGSPEVLAMFPETAPSKSGTRNQAARETQASKGSEKARVGGKFGHDDSGGSAARFFYCAKAGKRDRNEGLDHMEQRAVAGVGALRDGGRESQPRANHHPTVKPTDLMRHLCRLVTPPGGLIVDPFAGSGSTGKAAALEGFQFLGFELDPTYAAIANARYDAAVSARLADATC